MGLGFWTDRRDQRWLSDRKLPVARTAADMAQRDTRNADGYAAVQAGDADTESLFDDDQIEDEADEPGRWSAEQARRQQQRATTGRARRLKERRAMNLYASKQASGLPHSALHRRTYTVAKYRDATG